MLLQRRSHGAIPIRVLCLFSSAFMVLALASYLFSLVAGDAGAATCKRMWTESVISSGVLGVGGIAVTSGIGWLIAAHLATDASGGRLTSASVTTNEAAIDLSRLSALIRIMLYGISFTVTTLLASNMIAYVDVWYRGSPPAWLSISIWLYIPTLIAVMIGLSILRPVVGSKASKDPRQVIRYTTNALFVGSFIAVTYAICGTLYAGIVVSTAAGDWGSPPSAWVVTTTAIGLLMPAPAIVAMTYGVPVMPYRASINVNRGTTGDSSPNGGLKEPVDVTNTA
jgi:hypothetical protein